MGTTQTPAITVISQESRALQGWRDENDQPIMVIVLLTSDGKAYIPFTFFCRVLGIADAPAARQRASKHAVMGRSLVQLPVETDGGRQIAWCLERRLIGFWLGSLHLDKVRPDARDRLLDFQEQLVDVADRLLHGEVEVTPTQALAEVNRLKSAQADALAWVFSLERRIGSIEHVVFKPEDMGE